MGQWPEALLALPSGCSQSTACTLISHTFQVWEHPALPSIMLKIIFMHTHKYLISHSTMDSVREKTIVFGLSFLHNSECPARCLAHSRCLKGNC